MKYLLPILLIFTACSSNLAGVSDMPDREQTDTHILEYPEPCYWGDPCHGDYPEPCYWGDPCHEPIDGFSVHDEEPDTTSSKRNGQEL